MQHRCTVLTLALSTGLIGGCLDASPVTIAQQEAGVVVIEAGQGDAGMPLDAYAHPECRECVAASPDPGPGCGDKLTNCAATPACMLIYDCAYDLGCVTKPTQNESIACALPCAAALGLTNVQDPSIQAAIRLTECFHSVCASKCEIVELGAPSRPLQAR